MTRELPLAKHQGVNSCRVVAVAELKPPLLAVSTRPFILSFLQCKLGTHAIFLYMITVQFIESRQLI